MQVARYLAHMPHPFKRSHAKRFVTFGMENPGLVFGIVLDKFLVGALQMRDQLEYFLDPKFWRKGVATCAVGQAIDLLFENTCQQQITSGYFLQNRASGRVLEKLGFSRGTQRIISTRHLPMAIYQSVILQRTSWRCSNNLMMIETISTANYSTGI
jgi:RimJ/RimL family protein N-acetyltransferase